MIRVLQRLLWLPLGYLAAVTAAGLREPQPRAPGPGHTHVCVVVPARNEESVIEATIRSIHDADYPAAALRVVVIADDCADRTAAVASDAGAEVWERAGATPRGKGAALRWAIARLLDEDATWDALAVIDADTIVDRGFFRAAESRLDAGAAAVQGRYDVSNAGDTIVSRLAEASFAAQSVLRPRGRAELGGAAKLQGNGMVFRRALLAEHGWSGEGLAEDVDYWLKLVRAGVRPQYEPGAVVAGAMPTSMAAARVQRFRWEAGRAELVRRHLPAGLREAWIRRDGVLAEALVSELAFPPLATTAGLVALVASARALAGDGGRSTALAQTGVLAVHALAALRVARAPRATYAALALAPAVVAWKAALKVEALRRGGRAEWQTTPRG